MLLPCSRIRSRRIRRTTRYDPRTQHAVCVSAACAHATFHLGGKFVTFSSTSWTSFYALDYTEVSVVVVVFFFILFSSSFFPVRCFDFRSGPHKWIELGRILAFGRVFFPLSH